MYSRAGDVRIPRKSELPAPRLLRHDLTPIAATKKCTSQRSFALSAELDPAPMASARAAVEPLLSLVVRAERGLSFQLAHYMPLEDCKQPALRLSKLICPILLSADTCCCSGSVQFVSTQKTPSQTACEGNPGADCGFLGINNSAVPNLETVPIAALYSSK